MLLVGCALAALARVPVLGSGWAVVVTSYDRDRTLGDEPLFAVFLPAELLGRLRPGQSVFIEQDDSQERLQRSIIALEPHAISPAEAQTRFHLGPRAALVVSRPTAVAVAQFQPAAAGELDPRQYAGSVYRATVRLDSRRLASLLPLVGHFFGDRACTVRNP